MKKVIVEADIINLIKEGKNNLIVDENIILTPSAMDKLKSAGIKLTNEKTTFKIDETSGDKYSVGSSIAIASDHTGYNLKKILIAFLQEKKCSIIDLGTNSEQSCDYPDFAFAVAKKVSLNQVGLGIIIDATGIPSAITANKVPGIRAATCYNEFSARSAREHNNSNILVLGAKTIGEETAKSIINVWLNSEFQGGRHQRRLDKIQEIELAFLKNR